jgi:hypothetical protein
MNRILPISACVTVLLLLLTAPLAAQRGLFNGDRALSLEVRGGYGYPVGDFSDDFGAESDFGFGTSATVMLAPSFGVFAGWSRDIFDCEACTGNERIHSSGWDGGVTFFIPVERGVTPWLRAGVIWHRTTFEFAEQDFESDREWGFQGAAGFDVPLGDLLSISPAVRYNTVNPTVELLETPLNIEAGTVQYLSFDLGLKFHIPRP